MWRNGSLEADGRGLQYPEIIDREANLMNVAELRLSGSDASLDDVINKLNLVVSSRIKAGDLRRRGGVHLKSGVCVSIADAASPVAMIRDVRVFLATCQKLSPQVFTNAVEAELSLGVTVGDAVQYIASIDFSSTELLEIATLGIALSITAYPTSDEANDPANM
jgi:hypothetical protein